MPLSPLAAPRRVVAFVLLVVLALAAGMTQLRFSADYRAFFAADNPDLIALQKLEQRFARAETVVIGVAPADGRVFTPATLAALRALTDAWPRLPYCKGASSLTSYVEARAQGDELVAEPLLPEGAEQDAASLPAVERRAATDTRLLGGLLARDRRVTGVFFYFELPRQKPREELAAVGDAVRALLAETKRQHPDLALTAGGVLMFDEAMQQQLLHDVATLYPLCFAVMTLLLYAFFRSGSATAVSLAGMLMAVGATFGTAGWLGMTLNPASLTAGVVILTISIADGVHLLTTYGAERAAGVEPVAAMRASLAANQRTIFLTTLVNALGFVAMNFSDSPPYRDLGNLVALGTVLAWLISISFLPAWVVLVPPRVSPSALRQSRAIARLLEWVMARHRAVLATALVVSAVAIGGIALNRFGDNYVEFFAKGVPFRDDTEFINERLTGMQYIEFAVAAPDGADGVFDPALLVQVERFVAWLAAQPEVRKVSSLLDILKRTNQALNGDAPEAFRLPASREAAAQQLLFYEMSLPTGQDLSHLVDLEKSALRVTVQFTTIDTTAVESFDARAQAWLAANWPAGLSAQSSGISALFAKIARSNFRSMAGGILTSCVVIAGLLMWLSRSWRLGLISLVPNLVPIAAGFGLWGYLVGKMGMSLAVVASLTLGIVVDDTMHVFGHYGAARRRGLDVTAALREAYADVGSALWVTSATLVLGFLVLSFSSFLLTVHLGLLTALILALALVAEFVLTPTLLLALDRGVRRPAGVKGARADSPPAAASG